MSGDNNSRFIISHIPKMFNRFENILAFNTNYFVQNVSYETVKIA